MRNQEQKQKYYIKHGEEGERVLVKEHDWLEEIDTGNLRLEIQKCKAWTCLARGLGGNDQAIKSGLDRYGNSAKGWSV